jgi:hypothetical protein
MVNKDKICDNNSSCSFDVGKVSDAGVDRVESISGDIEDKIIKGEPLDATTVERYDLSFQFS